MLFIGMAYWSHSVAMKTDPGKLKWETFRNAEQLKDNQSREKWSDPDYRKKAARGEVKPEKSIFDDETTEKNEFECEKCGCMKVQGVHHCSTCGVCCY